MHEFISTQSHVSIPNLLMLKKSTFITVFFLMTYSLKAQTVVNAFNTIIEPTIPMALTNPLYDEGSPMSYNPADVATKGAAFSLTYTNQGGTNFDGYPSGKIGSIKLRGDYYAADSSLSGMPVQIKNLKHLLRFNWDTFQQSASDISDVWWATINVIFDAGPADVEPDPLARDYDLVIQHVSYEQDDFKDVPNNGKGRYWYFARDTITQQLKPFTLHLNGQSYEWAVRYKFFNYPADSANAYQNDKVHIKFIPMNNNDTIPFFDHSLKSFVDATKEYLQYLPLTTAERELADQKVADPDLWIKGIAAGYEVYEGSFTVGNLFFYTSQDTTAPAAPQNLTCSLAGTTVNLDWDDATDADFEHYSVYRSVNMGAFVKVADSLYSSQWQDVNVSPNDQYQYFISASDRSYNASTPSDTCSLGCQKPDLVITHAMIQKFGSDQITVQVEVLNVGYATVQNLENVALGIHASADQVIGAADQLIPLQYPLSGSLAPGNSNTFSIELPVEWTSDKHFRLLGIDYNQVVDECQEQNNMFPLWVKKCKTTGPLSISGTLTSGLYASNDAITIEPGTVFADNVLILGRAITGLPANAFDKQNVNLLIGSCL